MAGGRRLAVTGAVVAVGGANGERVIRIPASDLRTGAKYSVDETTIAAGGGAVNQSCRLLACGIDVSLFS